MADLLRSVQAKCVTSPLELPLRTNGFVSFATLLTDLGGIWADLVSKA